MKKIKEIILSIMLSPLWILWLIGFIIGLSGTMIRKLIINPIIHGFKKGEKIIDNIFE